MHSKNQNGQRRQNFCPMRWPKDFRLWQDWLKCFKLRHFGTKVVFFKMTEFSEFEPLLLQEMFHPRDWIKALSALLKSRLHFLECNAGYTQGGPCY